ncbi:DUF1643 domain-containing protein [Pseudomonas sp. P66]|uniref:DUF1643 domain-containing protein n=1 Tax=Pseudomonas arcuscaelestis TaxID=2710591 RepID=A0ABS2BY38_9PSED|nr:DUF1643 domain-containing protein [Pseudomonas arcuscaelestis]MBM5458536.1 DUF1643 domain-containing protein [Pseudomonas arcuscaelestis]
MLDLFDAPTFPQAAGAILSPCRAYRYALWRSWPGGTGYVCFIGLNPSTADETLDDPTIRKCVAYAKAWGYAGMVMVNVFGFRATKPKDMLAAVDPVGPDNDSFLLQYAGGAAVVVAAWGNHGEHQGRFRSVAAMVPKLHCLKVTGLGHPSHPLYLKGDLLPIPYEIAA